MKFSALIAKNFIKYALILVVFLLLGNAITFFISLQKLTSALEERERVLQVYSNLQTIWERVMAGDIGIRGYMLIPEERFLDPLNSSKLSYREEFNKLTALLHAQGYDTLLVKPYASAVDAKMQEATEMAALVDDGNFEKAIEILEEDSGYQLYLTYAQFRDKLLAFEEETKLRAEADFQKSKQNASIFQLLLLTIGGITLLAALFRIAKAEQDRKKLFASLEESNRKFIFNPGGEVDAEQLDQATVIKRLQANLENAANFIQRISGGNYQVKWEGMNDEIKSLNQQNLAGELTNMRDKMRRVKEEDLKRNWMNEGLALFSGLLRQLSHDTKGQLAVILSQLITYLEANQGAFFIRETEDHEGLELMASYAYGRRKFIKKTILPGEGLVGQVFLEKETSYLKKIPDNYLNIASGLGNSKAKCLLLVPLISNTKIIGVLEIASLKLMEKHQIELVEKIAESITASLLTSQVNKQTNRLLQESQLQSEKLRAQEEELRMNTEELQASQEAMQARARKLEKRIKELETENEQLKIGVNVG